MALKELTRGTGARGSERSAWKEAGLPRVCMLLSALQHGLIMSEQVLQHRLIILVAVKELTLGG